MGDKGTLQDYLGEAERLRIVYDENGEEKEEKGETKEMLRFLNKINSNPETSWKLIERLY